MDRHTTTFLSPEEAKPTMDLEQYFDIDRKFAKPGFKTPSGDFNWHCSCVSAYITGPCGYFFRNFMVNIDRFLKNDNAFEDEENRRLFKQIHYELTGCLKTYPTYYKSFIEEYELPLENLMKDAPVQPLRPSGHKIYGELCTLRFLSGSEKTLLSPSCYSVFEVLRSSRFDFRVHREWSYIHARITKNSMHPDIDLFVSHIMHSRLERHILVCPNNPSNHEELLRINSAVGNTPMNIQTLPALTSIQPEVCRFIKKLFLLEDELSLTDFVHSVAATHFEPVFGVALGNTRHWSVNGFPGRLIRIASSSGKPEVSSDHLIKTEFDTGINEEEKSCLAGSRGAKRHIYQNGCLVNILKTDKLLSTEFNYVEFGAGRGGLSHWVNVCLASNAIQLGGGELCRPREPADSNFLLVEQKSMRYKFDSRNRDIGNFTRVRMDIAQLDLKSVPSFQNSRKPVVAIAKHLCGDATDLALRCLKNASTKNEETDQVIRLGGIMFAVCCHHQCSWEEAVGRPWLEREAGLTDREFAIAARLTSWATCGFKREQPRVVEPSPQTEISLFMMMEAITRLVV
ncbi:hypothetical protein AHF37_01238 [Paragonimus kellicotti]|nr:hypothetical protein AHF37_01238 [Paragonimus kellicotti]